MSNIVNILNTSLWAENSFNYILNENSIWDIKKYWIMECLMIKFIENNDIYINRELAADIYYTIRSMEIAFAADINPNDAWRIKNLTNNEIMFYHNRFFSVINFFWSTKNIQNKIKIFSINKLYNKSNVSLKKQKKIIFKKNHFIDLLDEYRIWDISYYWKFEIYLIKILKKIIKNNIIDNNLAKKLYYYGLSLQKAIDATLNPNIKIDIKNINEDDLFFYYDRFSLIMENLWRRNTNSMTINEDFFYQNPMYKKWVDTFK